MGVIIYSFDLNISPQMSHSVLECDIVIKDFVIKKGIVCAGPCIAW